MRGLDLIESARASLLIVVLSIVYGAASAATLVLNDGSVIRGDIKTLRDDVYTVETDALGTVRVRKQDIRTIDFGDAAKPDRPLEAPLERPVPERAELEALQMRMMQNADLLAMITALGSDPDMQAVLSDPEIMRAVTAGDFAGLMNHPKIIALMSNSKVREVIEEVH